MRITAGQLKGRLFDDPPSARAHPMSDRIKNALFNSLGDIKGLHFLDGFGGTGALSFEAISRGASHVTVCELDNGVAKSLQGNIAKLGLESRIQLIEKSVYSYINQQPKPFDVIIADPPYMEFSKQKFERLTKVLKPDGLLVLSYPSAADIPWIAGLELVKQTQYGNAALAFYRHVS
ncbi:MAG: 16S rRNA (guanine(966)-N(2))-methyltransferase RsmD [Candidatus Saccharibacteria bacterium]|nr:16S rRNA (guanine(966)-N(2))-methyltransferase RsmD [Candidatus Saccharibacteria bacterium]